MEVHHRRQRARGVFRSHDPHHHLAAGRDGQVLLLDADGLEHCLGGVLARQGPGPGLGGRLAFQWRLIGRGQCRQETLGVRVEAYGRVGVHRFLP
ncbi:hypothetical protein [Streptomyces sp. NPDC097610]|uniref:hypothetical protein n=1 Tax=Streptomyces sp. NPDC097610 TaxID=3157227 RepID=UPI00331AF103